MQKANAWPSFALKEPRPGVSSTKASGQSNYRSSRTPSRHGCRAVAHRLTIALFPVSLAVCVRHFGCALRGCVVQVRALRAATFSVAFLLLTAASVHAQTRLSAPPEAPSPASKIAHDLVTWLHNFGRTGDHHPRGYHPSPPLPRPRPATLAAAPVALQAEPAPAAPSEAQAEPTPAAPHKAPPPLQIND